MVCDKVVCVCVKLGVVTKLCVKDDVCESWCVTKLCVKLGVSKMVCDKVVCERSSVTVCERWCVSKMWCQR